jgi:hypothetical protein
MNLLRGKVLLPVAAGACLVFATFVASDVASLAEEGSSPLDMPHSISNHKLPGHMVLHGVRFDPTTGKLDEGSRALLDDAAELLKRNPEVVVTVVQNGEDDPNSAC